MSITDRERRTVYDKLQEAHGEEVADLLMRMLPYQTHDELVTRSDLAATTTMLRGEMAELRGEMAELRSELKADMAGLRSELKGEMVELRADVRTEIAGLHRWGAGVVAANAVAVVTALVV